MAERITGLILAGGQSRRMAREKAWLSWGGQPLIAHVLQTLRPLVDELLIAVKDPGPFQGLPARIVEDVVPDGHALGGLYSGLQAATNSHCFVCACDMPFLNPSLVRWLAEQADGYDAVVPRMTDGLQPLHAVYTKAALAAIEEQLHRRQWDLRALVPRLRTRIVGPDAIDRWDPRGLSFFNLNTPEDYARACEVRKRMTRVIEPIWESC